jgi:Uma2 family endonuclease
MATLPRYDLPAQKFVSEEEYLTTTYRPDCDYVDGRLEERNLGERDHAFLQTIISLTIMNNRKAWGVVAATDWRVQVRKSNYRIPDVTVLPIGSSKEPVLRQPPLLVIEILSPRDTLKNMTKRCEDYVQFGIPNIWIVDPETRQAWYLTAQGLSRVDSGELVVQNTPIRVGLHEVFAELDAV